jgi:hypothetical protein
MPLFKSTNVISFGTSTFGVFNSQALFSLQWLSPGVEDLLTLFPLNRVVHMNSRSPTFEISCSIPSLSFEVISLDVADHFSCVLSKSTALVLFGTLTLFNQDEIYGLQLPSRSMVEILLRNLDTLKIFSFVFSLSASTQNP